MEVHLSRKTFEGRPLGRRRSMRAVVTADARVSRVWSAVRYCRVTNSQRSPMRSSPFHISSQVRSKVTTILLITVAWSFVSLILFLQGYSALLQFDCGLGSYRASDFLVGALITSVAAGLIGGTPMVFVWDKWLRSKALQPRHPVHSRHIHDRILCGRRNCRSVCAPDHSGTRDSVHRAPARMADRRQLSGLGGHRDFDLRGTSGQGQVRSGGLSVLPDGEVLSSEARREDHHVSRPAGVDRHCRVSGRGEVLSFRQRCLPDRDPFDASARS